MVPQITADSQTLAEIMAAQTFEDKLAALNAALGDGTLTVEFRSDSGMAQSITGSMSGVAYGDNVVAVDGVALANVIGNGGRFDGTWYAEIRNQSGRWVRFPAGSLTFSGPNGSQTVSPSDTINVCFRFGPKVPVPDPDPDPDPGDQVPTPPSPLVETWVTPDAPVDVPADYFGIHLGVKSPSWIAGGANIPAPVYPYYFVRSLNSQAGGGPNREVEITFWSNIEVSPGVYNWGAVDNWFAAFTQPVDWVVYGTPPFYSEHPTELSMWPSWPGIGSAPTRANMPKLADFVTAVLSRYGNRIRKFQLWNEPLFNWSAPLTEYGDAARVTPQWASAAGINGGGGRSFFRSSPTQMANMGATIKQALNGQVPLYGCGYQSAQANVTTRSVNAPVDLSGFSGVLGNYLDGIDGHYYDFSVNMFGVKNEIDAYRAQTSPTMSGKPFDLSEGGMWATNRPQTDFAKWVLGAAMARARSCAGYAHNLQDDAQHHMGQSPLNEAAWVAMMQILDPMNGNRITTGGRLADGSMWAGFADGYTIQT